MMDEALGNGVSRVSLRSVTPEDSERLFKWRSDPRVFKFMKTARAPIPEEHTIWMLNIVRDEQRYIVEALSIGPVGFVSWKKEGSRARLGIYIDPERWGVGFGRAAIRLAKKAARQGGCLEMIAEVNTDNYRALAMYKRCRFREKWIEMKADLL